MILETARRGDQKLATTFQPFLLTTHVGAAHYRLDFKAMRLCQRPACRGPPTTPECTSAQSTHEPAQRVGGKSRANQISRPFRNNKKRTSTLYTMRKSGVWVSSLLTFGSNLSCQLACRRDDQANNLAGFTTHPGDPFKCRNQKRQGFTCVLKCVQVCAIGGCVTFKDEPRVLIAIHFGEHTLACNGITVMYS